MRVWHTRCVCAWERRYWWEVSWCGWGCRILGGDGRGMLDEAIWVRRSLRREDWVDYGIWSRNRKVVVGYLGTESVSDNAKGRPRIHD